MSSQEKTPTGQANIQYITGLASLLYLRGLNHADHFILAANFDGIGAFGNNIFLYRENERVTACFFHMLQTSKPGITDDVSNVSNYLLYYFTSFRKILRALPWFEEQIGEAIQEVEIVCFTDAKLNATASKSNADHIADAGGLACGPGILPNAWELFEEINKFWEFLLDMSEDIAEGVSASILKDTAEIFQSLISSGEIFQRIEHFKEDLSEGVVDMFLSEIGGAVDKVHFRVFLEKFKVFHSQPDEVKLMELVKDEFLKLCNANNDISIFIEEENFLKKLDALFVNFQKGISEWVQNGDSWLSRYSQIWTGTVCEVVRMINEPVIQMIVPNDVHFRENSLEKLSEVILENSIVCVNCQSDSTVLNLLKVNKVLEGLQYYILNINTIIKYLSLIVKSIERFWCSVLVIDVSGAQISELSIILGEIVRALLLNPDARLILVSQKSNEILTSCLKVLQIPYENYNDEISWSSFSTEYQIKLLKKTVNFQGVNLTLGEILGPSSDIFNEIQGDILHSIIVSNDLVIGSELPAVPDYFPRTLSRCVSCNTTILRSKTPNTLYAIEGASIAKIIESIPEGENYHIYDPKCDTMDSFEGIHIIVIENENFEEQFLEIASDGNLNVHYFNIGEKMTWKWSIGDLTTLEQFILREKPDRFQFNKASDSREKLSIITGDEDIGKTTFLRHIARATKLSNPLMWVVCLNLPDHEDFINNTLFEEYESILPFVCEQAIYPSDNVLSDMLFLKYWNEGNFAVFIDGFESVSCDLIGQVIDMVKLLRNIARHIFVGCDSKIRNSLCGGLSTVPFSLLPIDVDDQRNFFLKKWSSVVPDNNSLGLFVDAILALLRNSVGEEDKKLCCLPLLTAIVARAFETELLHFATYGNITVPNKLNLIHFYEIYVDKCCSEFLMKKTERNSLTQALLIENKLKLLDRYMILAVILMLPKDDLKQMNVISTQYHNNKDFKRIKQTVGEGSLITLRNDHPVFVHRTLSEYFLAKWLAEVCATTKEFIEERLLEPHYTTVRQWFDRVLCHNKELHWAVLNDDEEEVGALLATNIDVDGLDNGGRTALHLATSHNLPHMVGLLLMAGASVSAVDNVLGWRPIRYADRLRAWGALDRLLPAVSKADRALLVTTASLLEKETLLNAALIDVCEQGYVHLLEYFHSLKVDVKKIIDFEGSTALHVAAENGRSEIVQYLLLREMDIKESCFPRMKTKLFSFIPFKTNNFEKKPDVNIQRNDGSSAVILAAQEGHHETLQVLFKFGASPNIKKLNGSTALHMAVAENHIEVARVLLEAGAEPDRENGEGITPLHAAATEGNSGLVRLLLELGASSNTMDSAGATPLHWAAAGGHIRSAEALVRAGANVNAKDGELCTPLHWAALEGQSTLVRFLLGKDADVKMVNRAGGTAVHSAARENRPGTIRTFKNAGVDLDIKNPDGSTPLHWACNKGHAPAAMCLLELGADLDAENVDGYTALHLAALRGHASLVKKLLQAGAEPDGRENGRRAPPLHLAAKGEHSECVSALLIAGATINLRDPVGATALHWAAWCGNEVTIGSLLNAGADVTLVDNHGSPALHWASGEGYAKAVTALLRAGADPNVLNSDGDAALHWAAKEGHADVVTALLDGNANPEVLNADGCKPARLAARVPHTEIVNILKDATRSTPREDTPVIGVPCAAEGEKYEAENSTPNESNESETSLKETSDIEIGRVNFPHEKPKDTVEIEGDVRERETSEEDSSSEDEKYEIRDTLRNDSNAQEDQETYEDISPHTSSLFQKSLFDWGDDDRSRFSLVRLSIGASDNVSEYANHTEESPGVHQPIHSSRFTSSGGPVQRQISKRQSNEKSNGAEQSSSESEEDSSSSEEDTITKEKNEFESHRNFDHKNIVSDKIIIAKELSNTKNDNDTNIQFRSRIQIDDSIEEKEEEEEEVNEQKTRIISNKIDFDIPTISKSSNIQQPHENKPEPLESLQSNDYEENEGETRDVHKEKERRNSNIIDHNSPLHKSSPRTSSSGGGVFGAIYGAGSSIMQYARKAIWDEPSKNVNQDRNTHAVSFETSVQTVDLTNGNTTFTRERLLPNGLVDSAHINTSNLDFSEQISDVNDKSRNNSWKGTDSSDSEEELVISGSVFSTDTRFRTVHNTPNIKQQENSAAFVETEVIRRKPVKERKSSGVKFGLTELYDSDASC